MSASTSPRQYARIARPGRGIPVFIGCDSAWGA
jgi:hypothetical protein